MKRIVFSGHALERLGQFRQEGITKQDVINSAQELPGRVINLKCRCITESGRIFEIVVNDKNEYTRKIITVIGETKKEYETF